MKILTQRVDGGALLVIGSPLKKDRGMVVDLGIPEAFPEWNVESILARGYWDDVTASKEEQAEAIKLARAQVQSL